MKNIKLRPYIGITDFTNEAQVIDALRTLIEQRPAFSKHMLHVGVMMSRKTLHKQPSKWLGVFPDNSDISGIFGTISENSDDVYNCLHYADYDYKTTYRDLLLALDYAGPYVHALQLDMPWPNPAMISTALKTSGKQMEVILQIGKMAFDEAKNDVGEIVRSLREYIDVGGHLVIHRVLLDKSMGRGQPMDANDLVPYLRAISKEFPQLDLVVAGGLGPDSLHLVKPLLEEFPRISIDAQSKLRPSGDAMDPIDWTMAKKYLQEALMLLR